MGKHILYICCFEFMCLVDLSLPSTVRVLEGIVVLFVG